MADREAPERPSSGMDELAKASSAVAAVRLGAFLVLPFFDVVTDVIFVGSMASSCVPSVLAVDDLHHLFWGLMALSIFATVAGAVSLGGVCWRAAVFVRDREAAVRAAAVELAGSPAGGGSPAGEAAPGEEAEPSGKTAAAGPAPSVWHALKSLAVVMSAEIARPGPVSWARGLRLSQALLEDAVQVGVTYALVAGMKSQDSATLMALYTSTLTLSVTLGTEAWHMLHCCEREAIRQGVATSADGSGAANAGAAGKAAAPRELQPRSAGARAPAAEADTDSPTAPGHSDGPSGASGRPGDPIGCCSRARECGCVARTCVRGPLRCCCRVACCRRLATSVCGRIVCVALLAALITGVLVWQQLSRFRSGVASIRADVSLSVTGTAVTPDGTSTRVRMPRSHVSIRMRPYTNIQTLDGNSSAQFAGGTRPFGRITAQLHNQAQLSLAVGLVLSEFGPVGFPHLGCGLVWAEPSDGSIPEVSIAKFTKRCLESSAVTQGYNIPAGACTFPIRNHAAQAPYDPAPGAQSALRPQLYQEVFGEECARMTRGLNVSGTLTLSFIGTCDLSGLV